MTLRAAVPILYLAAGLLLSPLASHAQRAAKVARIGYLSPAGAAADAANREAFRQGLRELGYQDGQNVLIEARYAEGRLDRLSALAAEIVALKVDVLVASTTLAVRAAQQASPTIPIVMAFAGDPVGDGLVASLSHPGGRTTGFSAAVTEIAGKRIEYLHAIVPKASQFLLLAAPTASQSMVSASERAGRALGMRVTTVRVRDKEDVERAFAPESIERIDGVVVDLALDRHVVQILDLAGRRRLPTVSGPREFAARGGVLAYGANYPDLFRRSASHVDQVLKGVKPADLPVEQPTSFDLIVNLRAAQAIGLKIPPWLLTRAEEVLR